MVIVVSQVWVLDHLEQLPHPHPVLRQIPLKESLGKKCDWFSHQEKIFFLHQILTSLTSASSSALTSSLPPSRLSQLQWIYQITINPIFPILAHCNALVKECFDATVLALSKIHSVKTDNDNLPPKICDFPPNYHSPYEMDIYRKSDHRPQKHDIFSICCQLSPFGGRGPCPRSTFCKWQDLQAIISTTLSSRSCSSIGPILSKLNDEIKVCFWREAENLPVLRVMRVVCIMVGQGILPKHRFFAPYPPWIQVYRFLFPFCLKICIPVGVTNQFNKSEFGQVMLFHGPLPKMGKQGMKPEK